MSIVKRSSQAPGSMSIDKKIQQNPGPYVGYIKNSADVLRMGRLDVWIPALHGPFDESALASASQTITVRYCSPFAGQTPLSETGANNPQFANSQKSYGFWMVPPDIDTAVLVIFANGNRNEGFWIGCIQEPYMNHMMPGKSSSSDYTGSEDQMSKYDSELALENVPVAEGNRKSLKNSGAPLVQNSNYTDDNAIKTRPVHVPEVEALIKQGLEKDSVRGYNSSSARRETPSQVFGISTPGPIDFDGQQTSPRESINRHGIIYSGGGPNPGNNASKVAHSRLGGHTFVMDDGTPAKKVNNTITQPIQNELIRLKTRSGAQLLLHNSENLVYITNNDGTAWIEFTADGKIDIYAKDSISIHTENDFNLRSERDINLEAGRNLNIKATGQNSSSNLINSSDTFATGRVHIDASSNIEMIAGSNINSKAGSDFKLYAGSNGKIEVGTNIDFYAGTDFLANTGNEIHMNTPGKVSSGHVPTTVVQNLDTFKNAGVNQTLSIMKRVPTHEPYAEHENLRQEQTTPKMTDIQRIDERDIK